MPARVRDMDQGHMDEGRGGMMQAWTKDFEEDASSEEG